MKTIIFLTCLIFLTACNINNPKIEATQIDGKTISFQRNKGNCLACHAIENGEDPGNIGPALINIQQKFTQKSQLNNLIWDATQFNKNTSMPPFGRNKILTPEELKVVVDYIWTL
jgi:sulfur-oxidizing protein SoxX